MPQSYYVALFNLGRNSSRLTPIIVSPLSRGALRGGGGPREGLFRGGLFGPLYITE
jgi:hypothetical protein